MASKGARTAVLDAWMIGDFSLSVQLSVCVLLAVEDSPKFMYFKSSISISGPSGLAFHMSWKAIRLSFPSTTACDHLAAKFSKC